MFSGHGPSAAAGLGQRSGAADRVDGGGAGGGGVAGARGHCRRLRRRRRDAGAGARGGTGAPPGRRPLQAAAAATQTGGQLGRQLSANAVFQVSLLTLGETWFFCLFFFNAM